MLDFGRGLGDGETRAADGETTFSVSPSENTRSATGKPKSITLSEETSDPGEDPAKYIGIRVAKYFSKALFFGTVSHFVLDTEAECGAYWHVKYDDGDREDLDKSELLKTIALYVT